MCQVTSFFDLLESRVRLSEALRSAVSDPAAALRFLQPGRLVRVDTCSPNADRQLPTLGQYIPPPPAAAARASAAMTDKGQAAAAAAGLSGSGPKVLTLVDSSVWAVLVSFEKAGKRKAAVGRLSAGAAADGSDDEASSSRGSLGPRFVIDVLAMVDPATLPVGAGGSERVRGADGTLPRLLPPGAVGGVAVVLSLPLDHLAAVSAVRLKALKDLRTPAARTAALAAAAEVLSRYAAAAGSHGSSSIAGEPPVLDPQQDMQVRQTRTRGEPAATSHNSWHKRMQLA